jgi:ferredoxin
MPDRVTRKIIRIDEEKCDGCGACVPNCAEGALQIVSGKARLVREQHCDGLGACLGSCPRGAITIEERPAEEFSEAAAKPAARPAPGCPSSRISWTETPTEVPTHAESQGTSRLGQWPVQLTLVPPHAPFLQGADLLLAADCVPFACAGFHEGFLAGCRLLVACPKLDDFAAHLDKLTEILRQSDVRSLKVVRMEVPCCSGLTRMAEQARELSGKDIPFAEVVIDIKGNKIGERTL